MIDYRHVQPTVVRHCVRSLSPSPCAAYAYRHDASADMLVVDAQVHPVKFAFEDQGKQCGYVREEFHSPEPFSPVGDFYDTRSQADIHCIEKIAVFVLLAVVESTGTYVYLSETVVDDAVYRRFVFGGQPPIFGKVVAYSVRDDSYGDMLFVRCVGKHDAVYRVVQRSVASHNHDGAIAVVCQNFGKPLHRTETFGLHIVVIYSLDRKSVV